MCGQGSASNVDKSLIEPSHDVASQLSTMGLTPAINDNDPLGYKSEHAYSFLSSLIYIFHHLSSVCTGTHPHVYVDDKATSAVTEGFNVCLPNLEHNYITTSDFTKTITNSSDNTHSAPTNCCKFLQMFCIICVTDVSLVTTSALHNPKDVCYCSFVFLVKSKLDDDVADIEMNLYMASNFVKCNVSSFVELHLNAEQVLREFEPNEHCLLMKFVASCSRASLLGFKHLQPSFTIHEVSFLTFISPLMSSIQEDNQDKVSYVPAKAVATDMEVTLPQLNLTNNEVVDDLDLKRRRTNVDTFDVIPVIKPIREPRLVV
ncbi:DNA-binding WRKY transcription factor [Tanacetum coccineum]